MVNPETETYSPGEVLKRTAFYEGTYPTWKVTEGVVVAVTKHIAHDHALGKDEKPLYRARYGGHATYPIFKIMLKADDKLYVVSQLGFNKDGV